jgi:hypothetical protein
MEIFFRTCRVLNKSGERADLIIRFYPPEYDSKLDDYKALANVSCPFFQKDVYGIGSDAAQAFFFLPKVTTAYLIGQRRYGYETYWLEKGDLDYADFWTYTR